VPAVTTTLCKTSRFPNLVIFVIATPHPIPGFAISFPRQPTLTLVIPTPERTRGAEDSAFYSPAACLILVAHRKGVNAD
jgi:hypothetical protein